jgi:copper chaperone CopZ
MNTLTLKSNDIHCDGCAASIVRAVSALSGVHDVKVDVDAKTISVDFEESADPDSIKEAIEDAGFAIT